MSALDKLKDKAVKMEPKPVKAQPEETAVRAPEFAEAAQDLKKDTKKPVQKAQKAGPKKEKHPGGRTNTRGKNGKDYRMVNIAMPLELYNRLKAASDGNMTHYINSVLKREIGME